MQPNEEVETTKQLRRRKINRTVDEQRYYMLRVYFFQYKTNKVIVANNKQDDWLYVCMEVSLSLIVIIVLPHYI